MPPCQGRDRQFESAPWYQPQNATVSRSDYLLDDGYRVVSSIALGYRPAYEGTEERPVEGRSQPGKALARGKTVGFPKRMSSPDVEVAQFLAKDNRGSKQISMPQGVPETKININMPCPLPTPL